MSRAVGLLVLLVTWGHLGRAKRRSCFTDHELSSAGRQASAREWGRERLKSTSATVAIAQISTKNSVKPGKSVIAKIASHSALSRISA